MTEATETEAAESVEAKGKFYCPGCGKSSDTADTCTGGDFGHQPIAMVSSKELDGDPSGHTPAPASDNQ
jgi:hypothetical protein